MEDTLGSDTEFVIDPEVMTGVRVPVELREVR